MLHPEIINISPMCSFQKAELSRKDSLVCEKVTLLGVLLDSEAQMLRFHIDLTDLISTRTFTVHSTTRKTRTKDHMCYTRDPMSRVTPNCP